MEEAEYLAQNPDLVLEDEKDVSFEKAFGWYAVINRIAGDDITKHEIITKKRTLEILNQLLYLIEKDKEQLKQMNKNNQ